MTESDEGNSLNGSCCSSRLPPYILTDQVVVPEGPASDDSHQYNSEHVWVIPSLHVNLPCGYKYLQVHTLTKETVTLAVHAKCRVLDAYLCCCAHLGLDDDRLFGLAIRTPSEGIGGDRPRNEYFFLDPARKIAKYAPKQWKLSHAFNMVVESRPFLVLHFRVRIYVDKIQQIRCTTALRHYYLQLRENLLDQWSGSNSVAEERCWELAALALHADENGNDLLSFHAEQYFPLWVVNRHGLDFVRRNMPGIRKELRPCSNNEAVFEFCQQASRSPFGLNCHLYGLRRHKMDTFDNAIIGITPMGIETSDLGNDGERIPLRSLPWKRITRLSFDKRKVTISGIDGMNLSLYTQFEQKARYLLEFCRAFHQATLQINSALTRFKIPRRYHDVEFVLKGLCSEHSLNSNSSSNSTSGVVSDRPVSETDRETEWNGGTASDASCEEIPSQSTDIAPNAGGEPPKQPEHNETEKGSEVKSNKSTNGDDVTDAEKLQSAETATEKIHSSAVVSTEVSTETSDLSAKFADSDASIVSPSEEEKDAKIESVSAVGTQTTSESGSSECVEHDSLADLAPSTTVFHRTAVGEHKNFDISFGTKSDASLCVPEKYGNPQCPSLCHCLQQKLVYQRTNTNPNVKPRWITVDGVVPSSPSYVDKTRALQTATHLTCSEPKLHYEISPCYSTPMTHLPTSSYQASLLKSPSPSPPSTPPTAIPSASGLFQKQSRYAQRLPHMSAVRNINRVQSMPAHTSQQYLQDEDLGQYHPTAAVNIKHSQSSPLSRSTVHAVEPPSYERALLQQARARYVSKTVAARNVQPPAATKPTLTEVDSYTSEQEELTLNSRIRQYPMIRALWQEHQQGSCNQLATSSNASSLTALGVPSVSNPMLSSIEAFVDECSKTAENHLRRPSSCQDLTSPIISSPPHSAPISNSNDNYTNCLTKVPYCRGNIYPSSYSPSTYNCYSPYAAGQSQTSWVLSHSIMDLPPPPPYPPPRCPPSPTARDSQLFL